MKIRFLDLRLGILLAAIGLGFLSSANLAMAEHTVGRGAGYSESQVIYALMNFAETAEICRNSTRTLCFLEPEQTQALQAILPALAALPLPADYLTFRTEAEEPLLFPAGTGIRFSTEKRSGAPVIVNRTLLYRDGGNGFTYPISLVDAYGLVGEIISYQVTALSANAGRDLGLRLGRKAAGRSKVLEVGRSTDRVEILDPQKRIRLLVVNLDGPDDGVQFSSFLVQDSEKMVDYTDSLKSALTCDSGEVTHVSLTNVELVRSNLDLNRLDLEVKAEARFLCSDDVTLIHANRVSILTSYNQLIVPQPRGPTDRAFRIIADSLRLEVRN